MIKRVCAAIFLITVTISLCIAQTSHVPTLDELLTLKSIAGTQVSPDGRWVAYTVGYGDFKQDAIITQSCLANSETGKSVQLRSGDKATASARVSRDGQLV